MADFDKYMSPMGEEKLMEACAAIKHVALDMDGVIRHTATVVRLNALIMILKRVI